MPLAAIQTSCGPGWDRRRDGESLKARAYDPEPSRFDLLDTVTASQLSYREVLTSRAFRQVTIRKLQLALGLMTWGTCLMAGDSDQTQCIIREPEARMTSTRTLRSIIISGLLLIQI